MGIMDIEDAESVEEEPDTREKVERFIFNILESVEMEGEYVFHLFQHGRGGEEDDPVFSSEIEPSKKKEVLLQRAQALRDEIMDAAISDAENFLKGKYKYVVRCDDVKARCVFTLKVNPTEDEDMEDVEETPSKKGLLSQLMRHQERIMNLASGTVKKVIDMQHQTIRDKDARIQSLEERQIDTIRLTEDLMSGKHVRDLEIKRIEKKDKRSDEVLGMLMQGAPMLLQMVAQSGQKNEQVEVEEVQEPANGHASTKAPASAVEEVADSAEAVMRTMNQEQLVKIQQSGIFSPEQLMLFIRLAQKIDAKNQAGKKNGENEKG